MVVAESFLPVQILFQLRVSEGGSREGEVSDPKPELTDSGDSFLHSLDHCGGHRRKRRV